MMTRLTAERTKLYEKVPTPGGRFPIVVDPFPVPDVKPTDSKIRDGVRWLRNSQAAGIGRMQAKHLKEWLASVVKEEEDNRDLEGAGPHPGDKWHTFQGIVQAIWEHGCIPEQMTWMVILLLPKGGGGGGAGTVASAC